MRAEISASAKGLFKQGWVEWSACSEGEDEGELESQRASGCGNEVAGDELWSQRELRPLQEFKECQWGSPQVDNEVSGWEMSQLRARMVLMEHSFSREEPRELTRNQFIRI